MTVRDENYFTENTDNHAFGCAGGGKGYLSRRAEPSGFGDVAMCTNSLYLAANGYDVTAWDKNPRCNLLSVLKRQRGWIICKPTLSI